MSELLKNQKNIFWWDVWMLSLKVRKNSKNQYVENETSQKNHLQLQFIVWTNLPFFSRPIPIKSTNVWKWSWGYGFFEENFVPVRFYWTRWLETWHFSPQLICRKMKIFSIKVWKYQTIMIFFEISFSYEKFLWASTMRLWKPADSFLTKSTNLITQSSETHLGFFFP